jgi:hypothetical protein
MLDENDVNVSPNELVFEGISLTISSDSSLIYVGLFTERNTQEQSFTIENYSAQNVIFRIRVSISNLFNIQIANGTIESEHSIDIPLSLKKNIAAEYSHMDELKVKFAVEILIHSEEFDSIGSKAYWTKYSNDSIRKSVICEILRRNKKLMMQIDDNKSVSEQSKVIQADGASSVQIMPQQLVFEGNIVTL